MPTAYFNKSFTLCAGAAAMSSRSSTVTMRAACPRAVGTRVPVTLTSSNSYCISRVLFSTCAETDWVLANASIGMTSTPMFTSSFKLRKTAYGRRVKYLKRTALLSLFMLFFFIVT